MAKNGVLAVFGNVDAQAVKARVESLLAGLPPGELTLTAPPPPAFAEESRLVEHYQEMAVRLEAVTLEEVRAVAQKYFQGRPAITAIVRPETVQPPAELTLTEVE